MGVPIIPSRLNLEKIITRDKIVTIHGRRQIIIIIIIRRIYIAPA